MIGVAGKASIMGVTTEFVGLHKERHVFPLYLCVTKVSGVGEDSMFMGTLEVRCSTCMHPMQAQLYPRCTEDAWLPMPAWRPCNEVIRGLDLAS